MLFRSDRFIVILGDNIFEDSLVPYVNRFREDEGARLLLKEVDSPNRFGVAELDGDKIISIEEKPSEPKSNLAVTGIYMYDKTVFDYVNQCEYSKRGELEITDVNNFFIRDGRCKFDRFTGWWTDAGTFDSLHHANLLLAK